MKIRPTLIALAVAGVLASGTALAHSGPRHGDGPRGPVTTEQVTKRLGQLKAELKLQPSQAAAWTAFEAKVVSNTEARLKLRESRPRSDDRDARMEFRVKMMKFKAQAAEDTLAARKTLIATLTPEQKATLDRFGPGKRHGDHHRQGREGRPAA
jgi:hypothetical protein